MMSNRYLIIKKIGQGTYGEVFHVRDTMKKEDVAIKREDNKKIHYSSLLNERMMLSTLQEEFEKSVDGIPKLKSFRRERNNNFMVMELLGPNLDDIFKSRGKKFSLMTVLKLGYQMLCRIEYLHKKKIIHRDIKPQNFVLGLRNKASHVYIIDFGLAKSYVNSDTGEHISYKENRKLVGTMLYCSARTHLGIEQSRRDDLEALGYTLMHFLKGKLPWDMHEKNSEERKRMIEEIKVKISIEELCEGYPKYFVNYFKYCQNLDFKSEPDYEYLKGIFVDVLRGEGHALDNVFDWTISRDKTLERSIHASYNDALCHRPLPAIVHQGANAVLLKK